MLQPPHVPYTLLQALQATFGAAELRPSRHVRAQIQSHSEPDVTPNNFLHLWKLTIDTHADAMQQLKTRRNIRS
jgi:hypothetical protein